MAQARICPDCGAIVVADAPEGLCRKCLMLVALDQPHRPVAWNSGDEPVPGYQLVRLLGRGGMGEVWEALGPGHVPVAMKRVDLDSRCGESELQALELTKNVRHPHLLAVHGYWVTGPSLVIGIELADESLHCLLSRASKQDSPGLPVNRITQYLSEAAEALDYLGRPIHRVNQHANRIQHRDVKPANLLLQGGAVKVADFGLSSALEQVASNQLHSMTIPFAPPEFFRGETTPTSDQYSLGVTYYQLRTGRLPFEGTRQEIMHGHLHDEPELNGLNEAERRIVSRALAKQPAHRWAGCVKFIGEIRRANQQTSINSPGKTEAKSDASTDGVESATTLYRGRPITSGLLLVGEEFVPLPLKRTDVRVGIAASTAQATVTQVFHNDHDRAVEATYVFPLPEDAAVNRLRVHVGERVIEGEVREKEEARQSYEKAKEEGHGATLVEQTTPNIFTASVANILPGQEIRVEISYLQPLPFQDGQYRFVFPMVVSPRYLLGTDPVAQPLLARVPAAVVAPRLPQGMVRGDTVHVEVDLDAGVPLCGFDSPSHDIVTVEEDGATRVKVALRKDDEIPNRDFVLNYRVAGAAVEHALLWEPADEDEAGSFLLLTTPPAAAVQSPAREVIFVLDRSGSMNGEPIKEAKRAIRQMLDRLGPEDSFNLIAFDNEVTPLAAAPLAAEDKNLRRAHAFLDQLQSRGGTEMLEPLRLALQQRESREDSLRTVVFLTDGSVHGERELLEELRPVIGRCRIVGFGIGAAVNRHLINGLVTASRGFAEFIYPGENIARVVDRTLRRLSRPVLTDIELNWGNERVTQVMPERCPDLYQQQPLVIVGRYRGPAPPQLTIRGRMAGEPYEATITADVMREHRDEVPLLALWARRRIEVLMDRMWEHPREKGELREKVIELAIRHRLASDFTSFLAVEYRSAEERGKARDAATVEIPQLMPEGMGDDDLLRETLLAPMDLIASPDVISTGMPRSRPKGPSIHYKLKRVRAPRLWITYEVDTMGAISNHVIPFVVGVLADFSGSAGGQVAGLEDRRFIEIDRDNFQHVMERLDVRLSFAVEDVASNDGGSLQVDLRIKRLSDFEPVNLVRQIEPLCQQIETAGALDEAMSRQLSLIIQHPRFQALEGSWRGLHYLVSQTETSSSLRIRVLDVSKQELADSFARAGALDKSLLYQRVYEDGLNAVGSEPFGALIGDYEFGDEDIPLLHQIGKVAALAFAPFISASSSKLLGVDSLQSLENAECLSQLGPEQPAWTALRQSEESRFLSLVLPRSLARAPWGPNWPGDSPPTHGCWMNTAYVYAARITDSVARTNWFNRLVDEHAGLNVLDLPAIFDADGKPPNEISTEVRISQQAAQRLDDLGFIALTPNPDGGMVFRSTRTLHLPAADATEAIQLGTRQPAVLAGSCLMKYLIQVTRKGLVAGLDRNEIEGKLNRWLRDLIPSDRNNTEQLDLRPLLAAQVDVVEDATEPQLLRLSARFAPHLGATSLAADVRMVAQVRKRATTK